METLYRYLSARVPGTIWGWLPAHVGAGRSSRLPATPRRVAWAIREIARQGTYSSALAVEALGHPMPSAHMGESARSIETVLANRGR